jgi:nitrate/nitrite-specific signal transduction histidine kinase
MAITLKSWLESNAFDTFKPIVKKQHKQLKSPDLNDLAFDLATAETLSETLAGIIDTLQSAINENMPRNQKCELFILISTHSTAEAYLHHAKTKTPNPCLVQALLREYSHNQNPQKSLFNISQNKKSWYLSPKLLKSDANQTIWLLTSFEEKEPDLKKLNWQIHPIEEGLKKGLNAWYQKERKIKDALQTERSVYAAELHDSLAQVLGYLRIKSAKLDTLCNQEEYKQLKPITEDLSSYTLCAYRQARELITSSRITMQTDNLAEGVINSIKEFEHQSAIVFELDNRMQVNVLSPKQSLQILYIIRESLSNIVRHSHATRARILLKLINKDLLDVKIEDNGIGIDLQAARQDSFGMQIMKERADRIGGSLTIRNRTEGGSRTHLILNIGESYD